MIDNKEIESAAEIFVEVAMPRNEDEDVYCFYKKELVAFLTSFTDSLLEQHKRDQQAVANRVARNSQESA